MAMFITALWGIGFGCVLMLGGMLWYRQRRKEFVSTTNPQGPGPPPPTHRGYLHPLQVTNICNQLDYTEFELLTAGALQQDGDYMAITDLGVAMVECEQYLAQGGVLQ